MSQRFTHPDEVDRRRLAEEPPSEWEEQPEDDGPLHVLWGRVAALGLALLLAFALGRVTTPSGPPDSQVQNLREQLSAAREDNAQLSEDLAEAREQAAPTTTDEAEPDEEATTDEEPPAEGAEGQEDTYVVKSGDTLGSIAQRFYEDAALAGVIAEANGLSDPSLLTPGTELVIPVRPEL